MRKIERNMLRAIDARRNWREGNTEVTVKDGLISVRLHGNLIAAGDNSGKLYANMVTFNTWPTRTTASRLRALGFNARIVKGEAVID